MLEIFKRSEFLSAAYFAETRSVISISLIFFYIFYFSLSIYWILKYMEAYKAEEERKKRPSKVYGVWEWITRGCDKFVYFVVSIFKGSK